MVSNVRTLSISIIVLLSTFVTVTSCCSSKSIPKRVNVKVHHPDKCAPELDKWYCMNGGTCFNVTVNINVTMPACFCSDGFVGERCELKYTKFSYSRLIDVHSTVKAAGTPFIVGVVFIVYFCAVLLFYYKFV